MEYGTYYIQVVWWSLEKFHGKKNSYDWMLASRSLLPLILWFDTSCNKNTFSVFAKMQNFADLCENMQKKRENLRIFASRNFLNFNPFWHCVLLCRSGGTWRWRRRPSGSEKPWKSSESTKSGSSNSRQAGIQKSCLDMIPNSICQN